MSNEQSQSPPPSPGIRRRRSSFAEIFTPRTISNSSVSASPPTSSVPSSVPRPSHNRGVSVSTAGLSGGSPTQSSPFTAFAKQRRASVSTSSGSGSPEFRNSFGDEPAVIEEGDSTNVPMNTPVSPSFARRVSFGAQALRDVKGPSTGGPGGGGRRPSYSLFTLNENTAPSGSSAPSPGSTNAATTRGEGFNWSDALRDKTKRSPSLSSNANSFASNTTRNRSTSIATMEPPKEMPKAAAAPPRMKKPDALGERMLRGEFMMD